VTSICDGLLANDSVVLQTEASARNFLETCRRYLPECRVDDATGTVRRGWRRTLVWANPISIDPAEVLRHLSSPGARAYYDALRGELGERTIVRVDRLDPAKNVLAGLQAFRRLLTVHPEWLGRVRFLAFLVPSRTRVPEYQSYKEAVFAAAESINAQHGRDGWTPIKLFYEHNRPQALVALSLYDVLLVNSVADGMNLVAKEGAIANQRDGVLVLSTAAGAFEELGAGSLPVRPDDVEGTAAALHEALSLPESERRRRAHLLRQTVLRHDLSNWLRRQLEDLCAIETESAALAMAR
jgi:trehalose 6-phosphate synthase